MLMTAMFLPCIMFLQLKNKKAALLSFAMQLTLIGWLPATLWAIHYLITFEVEAKLKQAGLSGL
jgi:uncharacterized membrane protein YqaE (UPF0057 family)